MQKKILTLSLFLLIFLVLLSSCADANEEESGTLEFTLSADGQSYKLTGIGTHTGSTVTIPATYKDLPVNLISENAFRDHREIKKVIIPESITQIYANAFDGCTSLATVECLSSSINMVGVDAFRKTAFVKNKANYENDGLYISNVLIAVDPKAEGDFRIKDGTMTVAYQCFKNARISSVTIPEGCYHLGKFTFYEAQNLESVTLLGGINYLGEGLFYHCRALKTVDISAGCVNINERVFLGCASLESIRLSSNLANIKDGAFSACTSLQEVLLPDSCTTIGKEAFLGCTSLRSIGGASSLTSVGAKAFRDCTSLASCDLPLSAVYGSLAFANTPLE